MNESAVNNFVFHFPTDVRFGQGQIRDLGKEIGKYGKRVLLISEGAWKESRIGKEIDGALNGLEVQELSGVEKNPKLSAVKKGAEICRKAGIEALLAVGGRNVIDTAKYIACAVYYDEDPWDLVKDSTKVTKALPVFTILTGAATGSEMNSAALICNEECSEKAELNHPLLFPKLSVCDPTYQYALSKEETAAGIVDVFSQILEMKFQSRDAGRIEEQLREQALKALIEYGPAAIAEPENYDARYYLMWIGTMGLSQLKSFEQKEVRSVYPLALELSAHYDVPHGIGLSLLMTEWMRFILTEETEGKFAEHARNIWNVTYEDDHTAARVGIDRMEEFFRKLGMPRMLSDLDIDDAHFSEMAAAAVEKGGLSERAYVELSASDVEQIYRNCW